MNDTLSRLHVTGIGLLGVALLLAPGARAQQGTVAGRVTDQASGQPLVGARVSAVGTVLVTQTNADGRYVLTRVKAGEATMRVSAIGYGATTRAVTVTAGEIVVQDVALTLQPFSLDEVVVTATGEQPKREVANAVSTVTADSLVSNGPIANMNDLLGSRTPGVEVLPGAITGAGARVRIRGTNSLSLNNEPIYYIDGVRMTADVNSSSIGIGGTNPSRVNDINPEEIESYDVVKGPSASTLYGTDAANGVIVIKTKRGRAGKPEWTLYNEMGVINDYNQYPTAYRGWYTNPRSAAPDSSSQPANGVQCLLTNTTRAPTDIQYCQQDSVSQFNLFADPQASPNGTGWRGQTGLQVTGGSDAARYFLSGEFEKEIGLLRMPEFAYQRVMTARQISEVPYDQYRPNARARVSVRANLQTTLSSKLDAAVQTNFISSSQRLPQTDNNTTGLLSNAFGGPGNGTNGRYGYRAFTPDQFFSETVTQDINRFIGSGSANWRPTSWLSSRINGGVDFTAREDADLCRRDECTTFATSLGPATDGYKVNNRTNLVQYSMDANAAASYPFNSGLRGKTTIGVNYVHNVFARNGAFGGYQLPPGATTVGYGSVQQGDESTTETKTFGGFVEQELIYQERLYLTAALRGDDNSAFGKDFSAVYYPKLGLSWVISEEKFFPAVPWLSELRLRGALGASGTQPGSTDAIPFYVGAVASVDGADRGAITFSSIGNQTLRPERATELELGFESNLFDARVHAEVTYYNKRTKDALIARPVAPGVGGPVNRFENLGSVRNAGVELLLSGSVLSRPAFGWDVTINASFNHNKIEALGIPTINNGTTRQQVGYPIDGWFQRPYTYADLDGNGIITVNEITVADSAVYIGPSQPTREITLISSVSLFNRKLQITGSLNHKGGRYQLNGTERIRCESRLNCRGEIDPQAPLWEQARSVALRETSARTQYGFIEKADFIRFREFSATYQLPGAWAGLMHARNASVTLAARNLFLITNYSGIDPESNYFSGATGIQSDFQTQPPPTYWTLRVNLGF
jgi:TonB-linked SusC/RagA family outer membrane protein